MKREYFQQKIDDPMPRAKLYPADQIVPVVNEFRGKITALCAEYGIDAGIITIAFSIEGGGVAVMAGVSGNVLTLPALLIEAVNAVCEAGQAPLNPQDVGAYDFPEKIDESD